VSWYVKFATSPLVLGYNPKSTFAADLKTQPWYKVVTKPGFLLGRTDPALDPKGVLAVQAVNATAKNEKDPSLTSVLSSTATVFPEETLVGRLQSGQLDAGFFYAAEAKAAGIPTVPSVRSNSRPPTRSRCCGGTERSQRQAFVRYLLGPKGGRASRRRASWRSGHRSWSAGAPLRRWHASPRRLRGRWLHSPLPWLAALLVLYLVVPVVASSSTWPTRPNKGFGQPGLWGALWTSVLSASIATAIIAVLGIPLAYLLATTRAGPQARSAWRSAPARPPPLISGVLLLALVGPYTPLGRLFGGHLTDSLVGIVLAQTFVAAPFLIVAARQRLRTVSSAYTDVAATLGMGEFATFLRSVCPLRVRGSPRAAAGVAPGLR